MDDERSGEALVGPEGPDPRFGEGILRWIERHELQGPAAVVLELHRPLMPLAWTAAVLAGAFVAPLLGPNYYRKIEALRDPALLDRMIRRLESSAPNPPTS